MTPRRAQDGAGVVLVLALVAVLITVAVVAGSVIALVVAQRRAQAAADLAALAAAADLRFGGDGCAAADIVTRRNGAASESCTVAGSEVTVVVRVSLPRAVGGPEIRARARAGPPR